MQLFLGALALADVEHEADQRFDLALGVAHHMHHVAYPDVAVVPGEGAVVGLVVDAGLGLREAEVDDLLAVLGVDALGQSLALTQLAWLQPSSGSICGPM